MREFLWNSKCRYSVSPFTKSNLLIASKCSHQFHFPSWKYFPSWSSSWNVVRRIDNFEGLKQSCMCWSLRTPILQNQVSMTVAGSLICLYKLKAWKSLISLSWICIDFTSVHALWFLDTVDGIYTTFWEHILVQILPGAFAALQNKFWNCLSTKNKYTTPNDWSLMIYSTFSSEGGGFVANQVIHRRRIVNSTGKHAKLIY